MIEMVTYLCKLSINKCGGFEFTWITHSKYYVGNVQNIICMYDTISKDSKVNVFLTLYYTCIRKMWKHLKHNAWCIMNKKCLQCENILQ